MLKGKDKNFTTKAQRTQSFTLEKAVDHSGHGEHGEKQGLLHFFQNTRRVTAKKCQKLRLFAVHAVPQGYYLRGMFAVVELRFLGSACYVSRFVAKREANLLSHLFGVSTTGVGTEVDPVHSFIGIDLYSFAQPVQFA